MAINQPDWLESAGSSIQEYVPFPDGGFTPFFWPQHTLIEITQEQLPADKIRIFKEARVRAANLGVNASKLRHKKRRTYKYCSGNGGPESLAVAYALADNADIWYLREGDYTHTIVTKGHPRILGTDPQTAFEVHFVTSTRYSNLTAVRYVPPEEDLQVMQESNAVCDVLRFGRRGVLSKVFLNCSPIGDGELSFVNSGEVYHMAGEHLERLIGKFGLIPLRSLYVDGLKTITNLINHLQKNPAGENIDLELCFHEP